MKKLILVYVIFALISCVAESESNTIFDAGYDYFPLADEGTTFTYDIELTTFSNSGMDVEKSIFVQREDVIESSALSNSKSTYKTEVWQSRSGSDPWNYISVNTTELNELQGIQSVDSDRIIKMVFPIEIEREWDGLGLIGETHPINITGEQIDFYKNWNFKILGFESNEQYSDILVIQQADYDNGLERRYSIEKYAKNVGLIYAEQMILDTQCRSECQNLEWEAKAHNGIIMTKSLSSIN